MALSWLIRLNCRKDAIRNTIAAMTLGKDVSALFPDIIKNMVGISYEMPILG